MIIVKKTLTYSSFLVASLVVIAIFVTSKTYIQLAIAIVLYPALAYLAFKVFPRKTRIVKPVMLAQPEPVEAKGEKLGIADIDKRAFLKLIGGAGIALFLFSIFNKKSEGLFFKSLPGSEAGVVALQDTAGRKIDPAQNHPTDGYKISEIDDNAVTFYGFTGQGGAWFIMREDTDTGSFRYSKGASGFADSWKNRERLNYDYYSNIF